MHFCRELHKIRQIKHKIPGRDDLLSLAIENVENNLEIRSHDRIPYKRKIVPIQSFNSGYQYKNEQFMDLSLNGINFGNDRIQVHPNQE